MEYSFQMMQFHLPKPLGLEGGIHMCGCHLLEFLNCHICEEGGVKMTVNLQHIRVSYKKIYTS